MSIFSERAADVHALALPIVSIDYRVERPSLSVAIRVPWAVALDPRAVAVALDPRPVGRDPLIRERVADDGPLRLAEEAQDLAEVVHEARTRVCA